MNNSQIIAATIKNRAKSQGVSIGTMLEKCEMSKNALSSMQSGGFMPRLENICKIADYLNCSVDYLLGRTDNPELSGESYYINGDNNGIQSNKGTVKVENSHKTDITEEFIQAFETLELSDKVDVMSFTMRKMKKED